MKTKQDLRDEIKLLKEVIENTQVTFSKKELEEFITKNILANLSIGVNNLSYSGSGETTKEIFVSWQNIIVDTSVSFE